MKISWLALIALVVAVGLPTISSAQEKAAAAEPDPGALAAAKALFGVMDMQKILDDSMEAAMDAQMEQLKQIGIGPAGLAELKAEMLKFIGEVISWKEVEPEMLRLYASNFTAAELNDLTTFYQTPTGQKALRLTPKLMSAGMKMGQDRMMARMGELQQRIAPIIQKHTNR